MPGVTTTEAFVYLKLRKQTYSWGTPEYEIRRDTACTNGDNTCQSAVDVR